MAARTREQITPTQKGRGTRFGNWIGGHQTTMSVAQCSDVTGEFDNAYFNVERWTSTGGRMNGTATNGSQWFDYFADAADFSSNWNHLGVSGDLPTEPEAVAKGCARANPSTPYVDIPVAVAELRELPQLIYDSGRSLIRKAAGANLKYQFGIAPLAGDLAKLTRFNEEVEKRLRLIQRAQQQQGYRKTVKTGSACVSTQKWQLWHSNYTSISSWCYGQTVAVQKVHSRWSPLGDFSKYTSPASQRLLAIRAVGGLTIDFSTAWELYPWSWLVDWFSNVGDYIAANRNIIPLSLTGIAYMLERTTTWTGDGLRQGSSSLTMSPFRHQRVSKLRKPSGLSLSAQLPFLDGRQVGILGSLAVMRRR